MKTIGIKVVDLAIDRKNGKTILVKVIRRKSVSQNIADRKKKSLKYQAIEK